MNRNVTFRPGFREWRSTLEFTRVINETSTLRSHSLKWPRNFTLVVTDVNLTS